MGRTRGAKSIITVIDEAVIAIAAAVLEIESRVTDHGDQICSLVIRRQGQKLNEAGGALALGAALADVLALSPVNVDRRRAIITTAWAGLLGWRS